MKEKVNIIFLWILPFFVSGQSNIKHNPLTFFLEADVNYFQWHTQYDWYIFDPQVGWTVGLGINFKKTDRSIIGLIGSAALNHQQTYTASGDENLFFQGIQLKAGPSFNLRWVSLELFIWDQYVLKYSKISPQPPGFGFTEEELHKNWIGIHTGINVKVLAGLELCAGLDYTINSSYDETVYRMGSIPIDILGNHPNWYSAGIRWYFFSSGHKDRLISTK